MSDAIAYRIQNGTLYADVYSNGLFPGAVPSSLGSTYTYQWRVGTLIDGTYQFVDLGESTNQVSALDPSKVYQVIAQQSGVVTTGSLFQFATQNISNDYAATLIGSNYVGVTGIRLDGIFDGTSAGKYYSINNLTSVNYFTVDLISGKFQINGGDLIDLVNFGSYSNAASGIYFSPGNENGSYGSVYEVFLGNQSGINLGRLINVENIIGTPGSDYIDFVGNSFNHFIDAGQGDNNITTYGGSDTVVAGSGNDVISVGTGSAVVLAGGGSNLITANDGSFFEITTGTGADAITVGNGLDASAVNHINAGAGDNNITAGNGAFAIATGTGDDWISVGTGSNTINLSSGAATVRAGDGVNQITASDGSSFQITTGSGADTISLGNDTIVGGINKVAAGDGENSIEVGAGNYEITTGSSSDVITVRSSADSDDLTIYAGGGNNTISAISDTSGFEITTGIGADTITVGSNLDVSMASHINAGAGNNKLTAGNGAFVIDTGTGDDWISVGTGSNTINLSSGAATVSAGNGANQITASDGSFFQITTGSGADTISLGNDTAVGGVNKVAAGDGENNIQVGSGNYEITTGGSSDVITVRSSVASDELTIYAGGGNNSISAISNTSGFEITTGIGVDTITVGSNLDATAPSHLDAGGGANKITTGAGDFVITVGADNDTITLSSDYESDLKVFDTGGNNTIRAFTANNFDITTGGGDDNVTIGGTGNLSTFNRVELGGGDNTLTVGQVAISNTDHIINGQLSVNDIVVSGQYVDEIPLNLSYSGDFYISMPTASSASGAGKLGITNGFKYSIGYYSNSTWVQSASGQHIVGSSPLLINQNTLDPSKSNILRLFAWDFGGSLPDSMGTYSLILNYQDARERSGDFLIHTGSGADNITVNSTYRSDVIISDDGGRNNIKAYDADLFDITTGAGGDTITIGNDIAPAYGGINKVSAGDGANIIQVGFGTYQISTGVGADVITVLASENSDKLSLIAGDGNNTITANSNTSGYEITTGTGADTITVGSNLDVTTASHIDAGGGANNVTVGSGDFTITVGSEDDTVKLNGDVDSDFKVFDSGGINRITSIAGNVHSFEINTGSGSDEITLGGVSQSGLINHINAGEGNNSITLGANLVNRNHVINGQLESSDLVVNGQYVDEIPLNLSYSGDFYISMPTALSMPAVGYPTGAGILGIKPGFKYSIGYYSDSNWVQSASGQHFIGSAPLLISQNALDHSKNNILRLFAWDFGGELSRSMGTYSLILNYQDQVIRSGDYHIVTGSGADLINISSALGSDLMVMDAGGANTVRALDADHIEVTTGNDADSITVGNGLDGSAVNHINAGAGNNSITAGNGTFAIATGTGDDWISVGTGSNTINLSSGAATVRAGDGVNQITASDGSSFQITTGSGADTISLGNDTIVGGINKVAAGDGQNIIEVGSGNYEITTGGSSDVITVRNSAGSDELTIYAGGGNNTISAISNTSGFEITTGIGADTITVGSNLDVTTASHIDAGAGANKITTGAGNFWVTVGSDADDITLNSAAGSDLKVVDSGGANTIRALAASSFEITTGSGNDTITLGNDTAYDVSSMNHVSAGEGQNIVQVGSGSYVISAGDSADVIIALSSAISDELVILAGDGNNTITASSDTAGIEITTGSGADTISLGSNLDGTTPSHIDAGAGANQITTGSGDFWVTVGSEADAITLNSASGSDLKVIDAGGANTIKALDGASFEITTGSGNDTITLGNDTAYDVSSVNHVLAGEGQNTIQVGSGSYVISAGDSADVITALSSAISDELVILAGDGNNTITASSDTAGIEITTGSGADTISLGSNLDGTTPSHIDAGAGANQITTGSGDFWVTVGSEADTITLNSASGSDLKVIDAGGANTIKALDGASFEITTGSGNDTITLGNDTAYDVSSVNHVLAGEGQNTIQVGSGSYVISAGDSADVITALSSAISDELVILAGGGNNTITSRSDTAGFEITTGSGDDTITLGGNLDVTTRSHIDAGAGANKISTGAGDFWVTVGSGGDDITLNSASGSDLTVIDSGGANQIKAQDASSFEITVGSGNDTITLGNDLDVSSTSVNHIDAGAGNNLIQAGNGNFVISTGSGIDAVVLGDGSNVINTGSGIAKITVGNGANQITTTEGNYDITAGSGSDIIHVGNGTTVNNGAIFSNATLSGTSSRVVTLANGAIVTLTEATINKTTSNANVLMSTGQTIDYFSSKRGEQLRELSITYEKSGITQVYKHYGADNSSLNPTVAALSDGGFAVAWQSLRAFQASGPDQNYYEREIDIYLQRFSASGSVVQSVTQLTPSTPDGTLYGGATYDKSDPMDGLNQSPIIVPGVNGNFQVGWTGSYQQKSVTIGDPSNSIFAGDGDNQITAGTGNVFIAAGIGNDTILAGDGQITVNAGDGHNKITLGQGIYSVTALNGDDTVEGGNQSSTLTPSTVNVFTEKFNALTPPSTNNQVTSQTLTSRALQNLMPSSFAGVSWGTAASTGSMAVQRGGTDRALMIYHNDVAYVSVGAVANVAGQQYTLNFDFSTAADSVIGSSATDQLIISVLDQNNTLLSTKNVVPGAFGTALSNLKTAFTSDALTFTGNGQGELKIKIQGVDDSTTSFVGTVDNISVTQQSARNEINVGEGNNTITLGTGNFKVTAGAGTDVVTIGAGYSDLYLGGGLSQQVNMTQNNGNQLISITTAQSGTASYTANSYVKIMNFDIAASNAALLTGQATRKDLVQFVVKPNEIAGLLAGGATAPNWYLELVPDNPDTTGYTWSLNLKATLSGGNSITVSTIDFDWGSVDPLYGYTNYTLTYLQPKIDIGSGSFTYTTGLRYQPLNEVMDSAAVSASMGGGSNDTILLAALQTNVTGTPDTAVNVGAAIAAGARGGDVYAVRIQGTQAGLDNGIKTIVDSGNTSNTEEDAVYIEGIRSFSDLSFTRFQMINEGAKSLSIAYKQYLAAPDDQSVFASGKVNIFGEYNPSSPQYHIEKLQFSTATTQDGSNFLQAIQTYYLGEAKYDAARSVELHSVAGKANSLLVGTEDGSSIVEKFVIHTTVGATSEKEVRIYGFDSSDTIYFDGKVPTSVTSDAALSNMNGYTTDPHRLIVNFGGSDSLILMLDGTATLSNTQFDINSHLLKFL